MEPLDESSVVKFLKDVLPRIKTRVQLSALVATAVLLFLIRTFSPENIPAQISGGMIGVCVIIFTLTFNFLHVFPAVDRARVVLVLFGVFAAIVVVLVVLTGQYLLGEKSRVYSALYETANAELNRRESSLQAQLAGIVDRKVREAGVLSYPEWKSLTDAESGVAAQIQAIQGRRARIEDTRTRTEAIVAEVQMIAQGSGAGGDPRIRRQAADARDALTDGDLGKAEDLFRAMAKAGSEQTADANFWLGRISELRAAYPEAAKYYKAAYDMSPGNLRYMDALANVHENLGDLESARRFKEHLVSALRESPTKRNELVIALKDAANLSRFQDDTKAALQYYSEAYDIAGTLQGSDRIAVASVGNDFGAFYVSMGNYSRAQSLYTAALNTYEKQGDNSAFGYAECVNNVGFLYVLMGEYEKAQATLDRALKLETETVGTNVPLFAITIANLAQAHAEMGQFSKAEEGYRRALDIAERILGKNHSRYGRFLGLYGEMLVSQARFKEAAETLGSSHSVLTRSLGLEHSFVGISHLRLGEMLVAEGSPSPSAQEHIRRAEATIGSKLSGNTVWTSRVVRLKGRLAALLHRNEEARTSLSSALASQKQALGPRHPGVAKTLFDYGNVLSGIGDSAAASVAFMEAKTIANASLSANHPLRLALADR